MVKSVELLTEYELDKFAYYTFKAGLSGNVFYGSDSLINLKRKIKELGWWQADMISTLVNHASNNLDYGVTNDNSPTTNTNVLSRR